jgi:hypothetical protein
MSLHTLPSARNLDAQQNLANFIAGARKLSAFGPVDFDDPIWRVESIKKKRASSSRTGVRTLYFTQSKPGDRKGEDRVPLRSPLADFIKALVRKREDAAPKHIEDHQIIIRAARFLEPVMAGIEYDPCRLLSDHFANAAKASRETDTGATAYALGKKLAEIADWLNRYGIGRARIDFKNPNPRVDDSNVRIGEAADARRAQKLPQEEELDALADLANRVTEPADIVRMRAVELLVCGGWRINELLSIPADCEVEELAFENGEPVLDSGGKQIVRYGIRYFGEKGAPPLPKWIPTALVDVAKRAISDVRRITAPSRDAVRFMHQNPGYIPAPGLDRGDMDEFVSADQLEVILGYSKSGVKQWLKSRGIRVNIGSQFGAYKKDVVTQIRSAISGTDDGSLHRVDDYLFLIPENMMSAYKASLPGSVRLVTDGMISVFIGGKTGVPSIFEKFGIKGADGQLIRMNTHQFRHWLNTLAQEGGMNQMEIARWSGRKDVWQNAAYDHVSGAQLAKRVRALVEAGDIRGPLAKVQDRLPPADRKHFREATIATAHVTDIGQCIHDWSMMPCPTFGDCAGCDEHLVVKGDFSQRAAAEQLLSETERLLAKAREEAADETYGASRWVVAHQRMAANLQAVIAVHTDTTIPEGTLVQPALQRD